MEFFNLSEGMPEDFLDELSDKLREGAECGVSNHMRDSGFNDGDITVIEYPTHGFAHFTGTLSKIDGQGNVMKNTNIRGFYFNPFSN